MVSSLTSPPLLSPLPQNPTHKTQNPIVSPPPPPPPPPSLTEPWLSNSLKSTNSPTQLEPIYSFAIKTNLIQSPLILFNTLLSSLSRSSFHLHTLSLYSLMRRSSIRPDPFTLPPVLRSASSLSDLPVARELHSLSIKTGAFDDVIVRTAFVDLYCSFDSPELARMIFDRTHVKDAVMWNTMVNGYVKCGDFESAREVFDEMPKRNVSSYNTVVDMYCKVGDLGTARRLFDEMGERDLISWNAMVSGYARVGYFENARELFDRMPRRNVVSWNVMINCYVNNRLFGEAMGLFRLMQESDVSPNEVTVVAILPACAHLGALDLGQWVHAYIQRNKIKLDVFVTTALVDMYGKCGCLDDAQLVFNQPIKRDTFLYNIMIEVLAMHGKAKEAFELFELMTGEGIRPNDVTFVALLKACAYVGLVDHGLNYFEKMDKEFGISPKVEHFGCMVDLLGRAGQLEEAYKLILSMPMKPTPIIWASLLSSCRIHENVKLAEEVSLHLIELEPESCGNYILLSNIYSKANQFENAAKVRKVMKKKGILKKPGCSSIEVSNTVHEFFAGDLNHPCRGEIYKMLDRMVERLEGEGYVPCTHVALHDVGKDGKEKALIHHSEKLVLAFGLIRTEEGGRIRIVKNLRVCDDCHVFLKMASKCYNREVVVRDCHRFHHFKDGSCSCADYW